MIKAFVHKSLVLTFVGMSALTPSLSHGNILMKTLSTEKSVVPMIKPSWADFLIHADDLKKIYQLRNYTVIWVDNEGKPNQMAASLRNVLLQADRHGLAPDDYWDSKIEEYYGKALKSPSAWISFELIASEALVRYAKHLSIGRFDPDAIDEDVMFKKKEFTDYAVLNQLVNAGPQALQAGLDRFAPDNVYYSGLMTALQQMKDLKARGGWRSVAYPKSALKFGSQSEVVSQIRARLRIMGYNISDAGGNAFDAEMDSVIREFQAKNGMIVDGIVGSNSEVIRALNYSVNDRIDQIQVNMEKLRWLPRQLEARHIFINLATNEFKMQDRGRIVFDFKTISGQAFRRTPSMRDEIRYVDFNPTWTVPRSIITKDKLPLMRANPNYLAEHNMELINDNTGEPIEGAKLREIDFRNMSNAAFFSRGYSLRQKPSFDNALGRVKFPLTNGWAIYLHDTNERALFNVDPSSTDTDSKSFKRHISSGCVRLEKPLELAAYLLDGNLASRHSRQDWSLAKIESYVSSERNPIPPVENQKTEVYLRQAIPVYMMNLTVELAQDGKIRFVHDVYGQDARVADAIRNLKVGGELF